MMRIISGFFGLDIGIETTKKSKGKVEHKRFSFNLQITLLAISMIAIVIVCLSC